MINSLEELAQAVKGAEERSAPGPNRHERRVQAAIARQHRAKKPGRK